MAAGWSCRLRGSRDPPRVLTIEPRAHQGRPRGVRAARLRRGPGISRSRLLDRTPQLPVRVDARRPDRLRARRGGRAMSELTCVACRARDPRPGLKTCEACADRRARRRGRLVADGLCINCARPKETPRGLCNACSSATTRKRLARREELRASGLCPRCRGPVSSCGYLCESCNASYRATARRVRCSVCHEVGHNRTTCTKEVAA